mmetsp:Transcript_22038/g.32372  ORF Transcript_22038/g.32372 Transcript_22038/m.32372 type:complete len:168 (+) Transcript_22038:61-564(+)
MRMLALSLSKVQGSLLISLSMPLSLGMTIYSYTIIYVSIYICVCVCTRTHACVCVCMCACVAGNSIQSVFLHLSIFPPFFFLSLFSFSLLCWFQTGPSWPDDTPKFFGAVRESEHLILFRRRHYRTRWTNSTVACAVRIEGGLGLENVELSKLHRFMEIIEHVEQST